MFSTWLKHVPSSVFQIHTLTLPGRGRLRTESLDSDMKTVANRCATEIRGIVESDPLPVVFYGASLGCLVAYEVARLLAAADARQRRAASDHKEGAPDLAPIHLFVAGHIAPEEFAKARKSAPMMCELPDEAFKTALLKYELVDPALLDDEEFCSMFLPVIRADLTLDESYVFNSENARLPCEISAFAGGNDVAAPPDKMQGWGKLSRSGSLSSFREFSNIGHDFLLKNAFELAEDVCRAIQTGPLLQPWHVLLLRQAAITPEAPAIVSHVGPGTKPTLSLGEFVQQASRLASAMYRGGVRKGGNVLMVVPSSYLGVVTMLAANICGARAVPVDPTALLQDKKKRVADLQPQAIVIAEKKHKPKQHTLPDWAIEASRGGTLVLRQVEVESLVVDPKEDRGNRYGRRERQRAYEESITLDDITFIAFTSGSTGLPKGMPLTHRNVANNCSWRIFLLPMKHDDVFALSIFWWWYWMVPFMQGAAITLIAPHLLVDVEALCLAIRDRKITSLDLTPSLLGEALRAHGTHKALRGLRKVVCYGEPLPLDVCDLFHRCLPTSKIINLYSTTENNDLTLCNVTKELVEFTRSSPLGLRNAPIGRALWNVKLHLEPVDVVDDDDDDDDDNGPSSRKIPKFEMYAHGVALPPGYVNRPEANAKAFVTLRGQRLYRCGDLVSLCGKEMVVLGRADQVVNVRGFRVGLDQVNTALVNAPGISEALAVFHQKTHTLVGFVVFDTKRMRRKTDGTVADEAKGAANARVARLRSFLKTRLDKPAVPSRFLVLRRLPKNARGKLDKNAALRFLETGIPPEFSPNTTNNNSTNGGGASSSMASSSTNPNTIATMQAAPVAAAPSLPAAAASRVVRLAFGPELPGLRRVALAWAEVLELDAEAAAALKNDDDFFEVGGHSLVAIKLAKRLGLTMPQVMDHRTLQQQARLLNHRAKTTNKDNNARHGATAWATPSPSALHLPVEDPRRTPIAIVGLAGRWPGAVTPDGFWKVLETPKDAFADLTPAELDAAGVPRDLYRRAAYVRRAAAIASDRVEGFDLGVFKISRGEARVTDPNQRVLLEASYEALEDAGYDPFGVGAQERVGVFMAGPSLPTYLINCVKKDLTEMMLYRPGEYVRVELGNDKDYIAPRVSFTLNLTGPSRTVQSACSSSLVCVVEAVEALRLGKCSMALAGGISIQCPQKSGYLYEDGMVLSPDGRVRPFDAAARGTIFTNGCAVVALKPLAAALSDRDHIYGVLRGCADNNDGRREKRFFAAPSAAGQAEVVTRALRNANARPRDVSYVEAHGTGTLVGDPIEFQGLCRVYNQDKRGADDTQWCGLGSVKGHIGHPNTAAGVCALSKVLLMMKHKKLPPLANFKEPNPAIDFASSPFFPCAGAKPQPWARPAGGRPRQAGLSAFGMGGTNAHVIIEEHVEAEEKKMEQKAKAGEGNESQQHAYLLTVAARTPASIRGNLERLSEFFLGITTTSREEERELLRNASFTLLTGRHHFHQHRWYAVASTLDQARQQLQQGVKVARASTAGGEKKAVFDRKIAAESAETKTQVVLLFSGQGSQYIGMGAGLYATCPRFREAIDRVSAAVGYPILTSVDQAQASTSRWAQVAVFAMSFAYSELLKALGVDTIAAVAGHSAGEYAAAVRAGVLGVEEAARLLDARGRLMDSMEEGGMMAVFASRSEVEQWLAGVEGVGLACDNAPDRVVVSGPRAALVHAQQRAQARGARAVMLPTAKAFHSHAITESIQKEFRTLLDGVQLRSPNDAKNARGDDGDGITDGSPHPLPPMLCNVTGGWLDPQQACDPQRWVNAMRSPVQFHSNIETALAHASTSSGSRRCVFVECGPGKSLASLAKRHFKPGQHLGVSLGRHPKDSASDLAVLLDALGCMWRSGVAIHWRQLFFGKALAFAGSPSALPKRMSLPTYAFDRTHCWIGPSGLNVKQPSLVYQVNWQEQQQQQQQQQLSKAAATEEKELSSAAASPAVPWSCVFASEVDAEIAQAAVSAGLLVPLDFTKPGDVTDAVRSGRVAFVGGHAPPSPSEGDEACVVATRLLMLIRALAAAIDGGATAASAAPVRVSVVLATNRPALGGAWGLAKVAALEYATDLSIKRVAWSRGATLAQALDLAGAPGAPPEQLVSSPRGIRMAVRKQEAKAKAMSAMPQQPSSSPPSSFPVVPRLERLEPAVAASGGGTAPISLRGDGVWVITGGTRGIGLKVAVWLARNHGVKSLVLVGRRAGPVPTAAAEACAKVGATVSVESCDVCDAAQLQSLLARVRANKHGLPLRGVVHSAGLLDDGVMALMDARRLEKVMKVKTAAWTLHLNTTQAKDDLDAMILFSSTSALLGVAGQGSYVAANTFLERLAGYRCSCGLPTLAIQWGAWAEVGMSVDSNLKESPGETHLKPSNALAALGQVLEHALSEGTPLLRAYPPDGKRWVPPPCCFAITDVSDWRAYARSPGILEEGLLGLVEGLTGGLEAEEQENVKMGSEGGQGEEAEGVLEFLKAKAKTADASVSLGEAGLDSLDIINLRNSLKAKFGTVMALNVFFDRSKSITALSEDLHGLLSESNTKTAASSPSS